MLRRFMLFFILALTVYVLRCETIEVNLDGSGDFLSIQEGINDAGNGDVVLVYPGRYYENIDFSGKTISVVSLEWETGERHFIHETIIDGNQQSCCVKVTSEEGAGTLLQGFTITNGIGYLESNGKRYGGGFHILNSDISISNCIIENNSARSGGGIGVSNSIVNLSGLTVRYNSAEYYGGGLGAGNMPTSIEFSENNRCNIYLNDSPYGKDICYSNETGNSINIYADTLTCWEPLGYDIIQHDDYIENYDDMILDFTAAKIERIESDLFISPDGDDSNSGLSPEDPLLSLDTALRFIKADSLNNRKVHLAGGTYYPISNGEMYPVTIRDYVSIQGAGKNETIIDLEGETGFIFNKGGRSGYSISDLTIINGGNGAWNKIVDISHRDSHSNEIIFENVGFDNCINSDFTIINIASIIEYINCSFTNISTGSVITAIPVSPEYSRMDLINCIFRDSECYVCPSSQNFEYTVNVIGCEFSNIMRYNDTGQPLAASGVSYGSLEDVENNIINCTFTSNALEGPYIASAPIAMSAGSDLTLINSIIWSNNLSHSLVFNSAGSSVFRANHNIFENGYAGIYGSAGTMNWDYYTNYDLDPLFFAPEDGDYRLSSGSPAINAGTLELPAGITLPENDILGNIRVYGDQIDIGAYEWNPWSSPVNDDEINYISDLICYPNPAYPEYMRDSGLNIWWKNSSRIALTDAVINIYNLKGQKIENIEIESTGSQSGFSTSWDFCNKYGTPVSSGIYFLRLNVDGVFWAQTKVIVVR